MPRNAIQQVAVDHVVPAAGIGALLRRIVEAGGPEVEAGEGSVRRRDRPKKPTM
jgi:hypothetical protein